jgi:hypothetical protein
MHPGLRRTVVAIVAACGFAATWLLLVFRECRAWPGALDLSRFTCVPNRGDNIPIEIVLSPALVVWLACGFFAAGWAINWWFSGRKSRDA